MNKKKNPFLLRLSLVVLTIIVILLVWDSCNQKARLSAFKENIAKLKLGNQEFKETINKENKKVIQQEQLILSQRDAIKNNLLIIDKMKKIQSQVRLETVLKVDSIFIPYTDTLYVDKNNYAEFGFGLTEKHYEIRGKTKKNGILLDSISFRNDLSVTIGNKSRGFFKSSQPIVEINNSNPFITTQSMQNVVIKNEVKWWDKKGTWLTLGLIGGFIGGIFLMK